MVRSIARGGMAEVFLARAVGPGGIAKQVCIKRPLPARSSDPRAIQRFMEEARTVLALQHANVVPVFDFGRDENGPFLVMEWIDGCDLSALLATFRERGETIPALVAVYVVAEVCKALAYAHQRTDATGQPSGILHRDVTPRNILLSRLGEVRLTDFGIARAITAAGSVAGTPAYMAPEDASGADPDARSDLYSLGLVLAEILVGRPLRTEDKLEAARVPVVVPPLPGVPDDIATVVRKLLAPAPGDRFATAALVQTALMPSLASEVLRGGEPPAQVLARMVSNVADPADRSGDEIVFSTQASVTVGTLLPELALGDARVSRRRLVRNIVAGSLVLVVAAWALLQGRLFQKPATAQQAVPAVAPRHQETVVAPPAPAAARPADDSLVPEAKAGARRARQAHLEIRAPGSWVAVYLDGQKLGDDVGDFEIRAGRHQLRVENPALHFVREQTITARAGETISLSFDPTP